MSIPRLPRKRKPVNPASLKNRRARGQNWAPVAHAIRPSQIEAEKEKRKSLAELKDYSWMVPGALAFTIELLAYSNPVLGGFGAGRSNLSSNPDVMTLTKAYEGDPGALHIGTTCVYVGQIRQEVKTARGPARVIKHIWAVMMNGTTTKAIIPFDCLSQGSDMDYAEANPEPANG